MSAGREQLNPESLFASEQYGFAQAVKATGTTVYVSGQVAWDRNRQLGENQDLGQQTRRALMNVEVAVQAAGGDRSNIVSLRIYILDRLISQDRAVTEALLDFFPQHQLPAATFIGVASLANKDFLVEIEAVAMV